VVTFPTDLMVIKEKEKVILQTVTQMTGPSENPHVFKTLSEGLEKSTRGG
jgi:hypothetical protein